LPAQYGLRTAGIVDIQTKTGTLAPGGSITAYGGQQSWIQPSVEFGGTVGQIDYYVTGEFLHNTIGIENPTGSKNAIHDLSKPAARLRLCRRHHRSEYATERHPWASRASSKSPTSRTSHPVSLTVNGVVSSADFNQTQRQINDFVIVTLQSVPVRSFPDFGLQPVQQRIFLPETRRPHPLHRHRPDRHAADRHWHARRRQLEDSEHTVRSGFTSGERSTFSTT
jgi:hypothetical protein